MPENGENVGELVEIMRLLLSDDGCPWDREQTPESLRSYVLEEAHEVVEAIDSGSPTELKEELGDLLFQIVFQSEIARAAGTFDLGEVVAGISEKMRRRHPHVFGDKQLATSGEVAASWEAIKRAEKKDRGTLQGVPVALPSLLRAVRIGEKAARVGLDWHDAEGVRDKVTEELAELDDAQDRAEEEHELGDLLFALASWARHRRIDPEAALRGSLTRFSERFGRVENAAKSEGVELPELTAEQIDARWVIAKRDE